MNILLTGATGYIGRRLLPNLLEEGHFVYCCVRDKKRFRWPTVGKDRIRLLEIDFLIPETFDVIPQDLDVAFYLVHSMSSVGDFAEDEQRSAENFREALNNTKVKQVIYLSGIVNQESLSKHLQSRLNVEEILREGRYSLTTFRAGIIIGSGSASYEIIRDLVEKLPVMIAPKWLNTKCQPIGIRNVLQILVRAMNHPEVFDKDFDIGGPDVLSYLEMLQGYAKARGLRRWIYTVPVMTPRLSSYWLYFVTSTSYPLAKSLVDSMNVEVVCRESRINQILGITAFDYMTSLSKTMEAIEMNRISSSWKDAVNDGELNQKLSDFVKPPEKGCFIDKREMPVSSRSNSLDKIWNLGGNQGWYYGTWLWKIRGYLDKLVGGVGLRRGRTHPNDLIVGDALDFWRVLYAEKEEGRLLLFAEMKLPGEAWLEFKVMDDKLIQTATFRPKGVWGRLYWYLVTPFHGFIFSGMARRIAN
ncbi:MAG: SDR family oxidoreductase [Flavobacteriales bacterium]|nr:MAG: SDR family oxidoreductase [Flavobacteriales bacterium]